MLQSTPTITADPAKTDASFLDRCHPDCCPPHQPGCTRPTPSLSADAQINHSQDSARLSTCGIGVKYEIDRDDLHINAEKLFDSLNENGVQNGAVSFFDSTMTEACLGFLLLLTDSR